MPPIGKCALLRVVGRPLSASKIKWSPSEPPLPLLRMVTLYRDAIPWTPQWPLASYTEMATKGSPLEPPPFGMSGIFPLFGLITNQSYQPAGGSRKCTIWPNLLKLSNRMRHRLAAGCEGVRTYSAFLLSLP